MYFFKLDIEKASPSWYSYPQLAKASIALNLFVIKFGRKKTSEKYNKFSKILSWIYRSYRKTPNGKKRSEQKSTTTRKILKWKILHSLLKLMKTWSVMFRIRPDHQYFAQDGRKKSQSAKKRLNSSTEHESDYRIKNGAW